MISSHSLHRVPAEYLHSTPVNGEAGGVFTGTCPKLTAGAEADGIIHAGWRSVNGCSVQLVDSTL